ncbi:MAG TPA: glycosyltransferase family 4 protein [Acidimicrobiales bacterium]|nr:glycosyltransferase family 4 protein [Acidimicrobiales bacterium]
MPHLLVTNDFPPKLGGIQSYLWELWRRLPPDEVTVLTTPYEGDAAFDAEQPFRVVRTTEKVLLPRRSLVRRVDALAEEVGASLVVLDPALPVGLIGPHLDRPYAVVVHGAEVTVPGRLPAGRTALRRVLRGATHVVAAGGYPSAEADRAAGRSLLTTVVPPGVDADRFVPLDDEARAAARRSLGLPTDGRLIVSVSRLVPRKGMDVLIRAAARLAPARPDLLVAIAGSGRDRPRLERLVVSTGAPVRFLGRVPDDDLPALYGCGDVFAMLCRDRWAGLEQEGFGIVFLEAAAAGVPQVAGASGGSDEAVVHGTTGLVVRRPDDVGEVADALGQLLDDPGRRRAMAAVGRARAVEEFSYDLLAGRLRAAIEATV